MSDIIKIILEAISSIAVIIITRYAVPFVKVKISTLQKDEFTSYIYSVVYAMQQTLTDNAEKKAKAVELAKKYLSDMGLKYSDEIIDTIIESCVKQLKLEEKSSN